MTKNNNNDIKNTTRVRFCKIVDNDCLVTLSCNLFGLRSLFALIKIGEKNVKDYKICTMLQQAVFSKSTPSDTTIWTEVWKIAISRYIISGWTKIISPILKIDSFTNSRTRDSKTVQRISYTDETKKEILEENRVSSYKKKKKKKGKYNLGTLK